MKYFYSLLLASILFTLNLNAQQSHTYCGHDLVINSNETNYPGYKQQLNRVFEQAKRQGRKSREARDQQVYTIDVVVHVVWKDTIENLPDTLIQAQIAALNEDYRRLNANASDVRPIFAGVVGDPEIEFNLTMINRVQTNEEFSIDFLSGALPDNVKQTANGGSDASDTDLSLNIWICKIQPITLGGITLGQILGYAYPPADLPNWPAGQGAPSPELEGVVIDFRAIGPGNPNTIDLGMGVIPNEGRTPVHEIGHYLGLRHIWGDGGGFTGNDGCTVDDGIADTPNAADQSEFDCDVMKNTCMDAANDLPDMIENYMDYSAETCMNSFTIGQIDLMRGVLEGPRCGLINFMPVAEFSSSLTGDMLTVSDLSAGATSYSWSFGDGTTSTDMEPTHTYGSSGMYTVELTVTNSCGTDTYSEVITVVISDVETLEGLVNFNVSPNPNAGVFDIALEGNPMKELSIEVYNVYGQQVFLQSVDFMSGRIALPVELDVPNGIYLLAIRAEGKVSHKKIQIVR